ncbi:MAG: hypothetical protein AAGM16_02990 [Pseudomonadota bacterium]
MAAKKQNILGLRFSNTDYTWAVVSGTIAAPTIAASGCAKMPKGLHRPQSLSWFCQEIDLLISQNKCTQICIKKTEPMASKGNSYEARVEHETTAYIAAANHGIKAVYKKVNATIAKDLGLKGKGKYLKTFDTSMISDFEKRTSKEQDAIIVAWSNLV